MTHITEFLNSVIQKTYEENNDNSSTHSESSDEEEPTNYQALVQRINEHCEDISPYLQNLQKLIQLLQQNHLSKESITPYIQILLRSCRKSMIQYRFHIGIQYTNLHLVMLLLDLHISFLTQLHQLGIIPVIRKTLNIHAENKDIKEIGENITRLINSNNHLLIDCVPTTQNRIRHTRVAVRTKCLADPLTTPCNSKNTTTLSNRSRKPALSSSRLRRTFAIDTKPVLSPHFEIQYSSGTVNCLTMKPTDLVDCRPITAPVSSFNTLDSFIKKPKRNYQLKSIQKGIRKNNQRVKQNYLNSPYCKTAIFVEPSPLPDRLQLLHKRPETAPTAELNFFGKRFQESLKNSPLRQVHSSQSKTRKNKTFNQWSESDAAAVKIQCLFRRKHAIRILKRKREERKAVIKIQSQIRRQIASKNVQHLRQQRHQASICIQKNARRKLVHLKQCKNNKAYVVKRVQQIYQRGLLHQKGGRIDLAINHYLHAINYSPGFKFASIHVNLGSAYLSESDYKLALENFEKALLIQPKNIKALYNLGLTHFYLNNMTEAENSVLEVHPAHAKAVYALGLLNHQNK